jgi:hypothetical protein
MKKTKERRTHKNTIHSIRHFTNTRVSKTKIYSKNEDRYFLRFLRYFYLRLTKTHALQTQTAGGAETHKIHRKYILHSVFNQPLTVTT